MNKQSGVSGNVISTPSGGGAVSGMGEKFSPDLFTGTGNFSVPIALPPGRNGFQPELSLGYSTGRGNGVFGLGWNIGIPGVSRKSSKGIPLYNDSSPDTGNGDVFILSGAEDLVPVPGASGKEQRYSPRTEGLFARIARIMDKTNDYWKVQSKDGLTSYYGTPEGRASDNSKPLDTASCVNPSYASHTFEWNLSKTEDTFGNHIDYHYFREQNRQIDGHDWDKVYLGEICYGWYPDGASEKNLVSVKFVYEERPDPFSRYAAGFEIRTSLRCKKIEIYTHPAAGTLLTKTYHFIYLDERVAAGEQAKENLPLNSVSLLSQVKIEGHNGAESEWMPPLEFSYSRFEPAKRDFYPLKGSDLPAFGLGNGDYELVDMFGKGLPDIIRMGVGELPQYWRNLGNGVFDRPRSMQEAPGGFSLSDPGVAFMDANGDGKIDLVVNKQGISGYFPLQHNGLWDHKSFQSYRQVPSFSLADPEVKLLDLDGDGITDVLRNGSSLECFFNDPEQGFYKVSTMDRKALKGFPDISFADPRIRTGNLSGSSLQDLVFVSDGRIDYWPNLGHGRWGSRISMKNVPRFPYAYDPARIYLSDVDGDGLADLIYIENNSVTLCINQGGNSWSAPIVIKGTPPVYNTASVRIADILGTGVAGILWTYDYDGTSRDRFYYLDFTGGLKPYLLHEMNNNMGALTRVEYTSSIKYYLEDQKTGGWKTALPFPVLVVSKVEVLDQVSLSKLSTEYAYHHGYWMAGKENSGVLETWCSGIPSTLRFTTKKACTGKPCLKVPLTYQALLTLKHFVYRTTSRLPRPAPGFI